MEIGNRKLEAGKRKLETGDQNPENDFQDVLRRNGLGRPATAGDGLQFPGAPYRTAWDSLAHLWTAWGQHGMAWGGLGRLGAAWEGLGWSEG